jgi:hypothetical protein
VGWLRAAASHGESTVAASGQRRLNRTSHFIAHPKEGACGIVMGQKERQRARQRKKLVAKTQAQRRRPASSSSSSSSAAAAAEVARRRRLPFEQQHRALLVGEGDFSFTTAMVRLLKGRMAAGQVRAWLGAGRLCLHDDAATLLLARNLAAACWQPSRLPVVRGCEQRRRRYCCGRWFPRRSTANHRCDASIAGQAST